MKLTVKRVGPERNEQHSSLRASAEHMSQSRSDCSVSKKREMLACCYETKQRYFLFMINK